MSPLAKVFIQSVKKGTASSEGKLSEVLGFKVMNDSAMLSLFLYERPFFT